MLQKQLGKFDKNGCCADHQTATDHQAATDHRWCRLHFGDRNSMSARKNTKRMRRSTTTLRVGGRSSGHNLRASSKWQEQQQAAQVPQSTRMIASGCQKFWTSGSRIRRQVRPVPELYSTSIKNSKVVCQVFTTSQKKSKIRFQLLITPCLLSGLKGKGVTRTYANPSRPQSLIKSA